VKQVARELGVRYVLEGSVRKAADRVRITGQLIDTSTGAHIWADGFDGRGRYMGERKRWSESTPPTPPSRERSGCANSLLGKFVRKP
jgi:hypothetical protein